ncbi:hypothetical protein V8F06_001716 [Rhypophila decipiens]
MAFSSAFFTLAGEPNEAAVDGMETTSNEDTKMSLDNEKPKSDEKEVKSEPQQPQPASGNSDKQQPDQPPLPPSPSHQHSSSTGPLPSQVETQQQKEDIPASDGTDLFKVDDKNSTDPDSKTTPKPTMAPTKKKKGTATALKGPKRSGPGSGPKKKKSRKTEDNPAASGSQAGDERKDEGDEDSGSDQESDSGPYCLCRGPDNHRFMIACDKCEDWFHGECIGMDKYTGENLVQRYICPNCSDGKRYVTRYKKMCSLESCNLPSRLYDPQNPSIFCSQEHCQAWWEHLIKTLPRNKVSSLDNLTRMEFVGLLDPLPRMPGQKPSSNWKLGDTPFDIEPDFWQKVDLKVVLTQEERDILETSAAERYSKGEEISFRKKMLQIIEMGLKQREAAIANGTLPKDVCGYDTRLDTVGATAQFIAFAKSPEGEAILSAGRFEPPVRTSLHLTSVEPDATKGVMCVKKKCKTHQMWGAILTKNVKHLIRVLASEAKEHLDAETRLKENAAGRYLRSQLENNIVTRFDSTDDDEDSDEEVKRTDKRDNAVNDVEMG